MNASHPKIRRLALDRHGEYVFVRAPDGRAGWLPRGRVEPIVPRG